MEVAHPQRGSSLEMLVFEERRKPEYPEKNLSEQRREPTTNSTHIWRRRRDLNPRHIGGRRALSPARHPLLPRLATSRPLGERSEPCLAAKRPTVPRHMGSNEGLFWKSTCSPIALFAKDVAWFSDYPRSLVRSSNCLRITKTWFYQLRILVNLPM